MSSFHHHHFITTSWYGVDSDGGDASGAPRLPPHGFPSRLGLGRFERDRVPTGWWPPASPRGFASRIWARSGWCTNAISIRSGARMMSGC